MTIFSGSPRLELRMLTIPNEWKPPCSLPAELLQVGIQSFETSPTLSDGNYFGPGINRELSNASNRIKVGTYLYQKDWRTFNESVVKVR